MSRALVSSLWRSCTTPLRGACILVAPVPTRSLHLVASPLSSEYPYSGTAPTRGPSMHPRYCGYVLPSLLQDGRPLRVIRSFSHPPGRSARGSSKRRKRIGSGPGKAAELRTDGIGLRRTHLDHIDRREPQRDSLGKSYGSKSDLCSSLSGILVLDPQRRSYRYSISVFF